MFFARRILLMILYFVFFFILFEFYLLKIRETFENKFGNPILEKMVEYIYYLAWKKCEYTYRKHAMDTWWPPREG